MIQREEPCARCGVRADVGCKHRAATGPRPIAIEDPALKKRGAGNNGFGGLAFHPERMSKDRVASMAAALFGKPKA